MKKFGIDWQSILTMPVATVLYRFSTEIKTVFYRIKMIQNRGAMVPMVLGRGRANCLAYTIQTTFHNGPVGASLVLYLTLTTV